jgi:hypothetical protein
MPADGYVSASPELPMVVRSLAAVAAVWLMACASGGDAADDSAGGPGLGDADTTGDGVSPIDSSAARGGDSGGSRALDSSGGTGADSSSGDDDGGMQGDDGGGGTQDSGGGGVADTGGPAPDSGSTSTICNSSNPIYAVEAAAAVASGHFTLCLSGSGCAANQCCYEQLSPGNICVAR